MRKAYGKKMGFGWESEKDKIKRSMNIAPLKKLEWLEEMRQLSEMLPKKTLLLRQKLRSLK